MAAVQLTPGAGLLTGARALWFGRQSFEAMLDHNARAAEAVAAGAPAEVAFFEPAAPVYALGRRAQTPEGRAQLAPALAASLRDGIAIVEVDRGGLGTLHAPGQIVAFVAVPCARWQGRRLGAELLNGIERLARAAGVPARRDLEDDIGVWGPSGKLASLGLRIREDVALHGVAVNIAVQVTLAKGLVLCGNPLTTLANISDPNDAADPGLAGWASALAEIWQLRPLEPHFPAPAVPLR